MAPCRGKPPCGWGWPVISSATLARQPSSCGGAWRPQTGSLARPVPTCGSPPRRRSREGRARLAEARTEDISMGSWQNHALRIAWLSEVCRLAGRSEEAWQHASQALDLARQHKERANEALALHQLGVVQAHADPL